MANNALLFGKGAVQDVIHLKNEENIIISLVLVEYSAYSQKA